MKQVYLLSIHRWLESLSIASAALTNPSCDVMFIDPSNMDLEMEQIILLAERLPVEFINSTGSEVVMPALEKAALKCLRYEVFPGDNWPEELVKRFGKPVGICSAAVDSPAECLRAAATAVRLGYYFTPMGKFTEATAQYSACQELLWFGERIDLENNTAVEKAEKYKCICSEKEAIALLQEKGFAADYLVILNSADLNRESKRGSCLGELWVKGLSLHALLLASYRYTFICDADSAAPDPLQIESKANRLVEDAAVKPLYQVVLGSPAVIPFFYEEKKAIGAVTEEMVRDIHVRLNSDLFFDLAEGRLMQSTPGGLSVQVLSTKHYREILDNQGRTGRELYIAAVPHVDTGIIFASDQSLMEAQLLPLLEETGCNITVHSGHDAHYSKVSEALKETDFFLFTGHGGPEGLHTHGRTLNRADLPSLPPLVAYASACSTVGLVPHWYSPTEGLDWAGVEVDSRQVIGLSFVEKGALSFVGGATIEDLQYSTSIYPIFMEALLVKGQSVGEAVKATRDFISLYAAILMQKSTEAYKKYRWGTANAIHQQVLLGDPAFTPIQGPAKCSKMDVNVNVTGPAEKEVAVSIPDELWKKTSAVINEKDASRHYYRCRNVEVNTPYGENIISWGDYYRVAPDADNISETAVMSSFIHLTLDLEPGEGPKALRLIDAEASSAVCLLCDQETEEEKNIIDAAGCFKLPYLLQPPIELDMQGGWAFSLEEMEGYNRLHWLVPLLLLDEKNRSVRRLQKLVFKVETAPTGVLKGKIKGFNNQQFLVCAGVPTEQGKDIQAKELELVSPVCALPGSDGSFYIDSAIKGASLCLLDQFPLYELLQPYQGFDNQIIHHKSSEAETELLLEVNPIKKVEVKGVVVDSATGKPINGALLRLFRGENDPVGDPLIEAYAGEARSDENGSFIFQVPAGRYLLYAAAQIGEMRYKSNSWELEPRNGEDHFRVFALDCAVVVRGMIAFNGYQPADPPQVALKRYPKKDGEGALVKVPVNRDGSYECLISFQDRFSIVIEEEGWMAIKDTNDDQGYKLGANEVLVRDYVLFPREIETEI